MKFFRFSVFSVYMRFFRKKNMPNPSLRRESAKSFNNNLRAFAPLRGGISYVYTRKKRKN